MQKFLSNQNKLFLIISIVIFQVLLLKPIEVLADLPTGNAVKDPSAILRNALPIKQVELQELQHKLEETSDLVRGGRWPALTKTVTKCQSLLKKYQSKIIQELPKDKKNIAEKTFLELKENFDSLQDYSKSKDKYSFIATRRNALNKIGGLEEYFLPKEFPYSIPQELQTRDPIGEDIGYLDPETNEERHVPLEIRIPDEKDTFYNQTFEDLGLYTETPTLPFATLGTLGWSHSNTAVDDGSSQFFFFLYEAELNPAGRNLIDGRNAAFGYVVDGFDVLEELTKDDTIISIDVLEGIENLKLNA